MKNIKFILYIFFFKIFIEIIFSQSILYAEKSNIKPWFQKAVLIKSYQQSFDWFTPWEKRGIRTKSGMALVINKNFTKKLVSLDNSLKNNLNLLTTAEMVANATLIEVKRKDILQPFIAKVLLIDYAANIALLKIDNFDFWKGLIPVQWDKLKPNKKSKSKKISTLKIKSKEEWHIQSAQIEQMTVGHRSKTNSWFPQIKINGFSKINQGYPLIQDNKTVGMVLEYNSGTANAIPAENILEFLKQANKDSYKSLAHRGFIWRKIPQRSTADFFKIPKNKPGIWISRVLQYGTGSEVLIKGDYLTKINKWPISYEGKIKHPTWGVALFDLLFLDMLKVGDLIEFNVIRDGNPIVLKSKVSSFQEIGTRVPLEKVGMPPKYIIKGGFLFQELNLNYLKMWGKNWQSLAPMRLRLFLEENKSVEIKQDKNNLIKKYDLHENNKNNSRVILVTQVIPDQINIGYQKISNAIVVKINNKNIKSLKDVNNAFLNPKGEFHRIDFLPGSNRLSAILPVNRLNDSNQRIQKNYRIPKLKEF